jgi:sugar phosphate isomerase/epimerase
MRLEIAGRPHLTYCTNIHSGETWLEILKNIKQYVLEVKKKVSPDSAYGIGLRLPDRAAQTLAHPNELNTVRRFLSNNGLYVFTINGFPQGDFHGTQVKEKVYLPDWLEEERLEYADRCAIVLAALLADHPDIEGSVSTVPGAFKQRVRSDHDVCRIASQLRRHAAMLHRLKEATGRTITCALEPEPCCLLETTKETVHFFKEQLFSTAAINDFSRLTALNSFQAEEALRRHLGVCLDACHAAVEYEDPEDMLSSLHDAGIRILKIQLSAGLRISNIHHDAITALQPFSDSRYLHQVVEWSGGELTRYTDLPAALVAAGKRGFSSNHDREWRIHFHVPIFLSQLGPFENTQPFLARLLQLQAERTPTTHLEIETYTWDVLPQEYRGISVVDAIVREVQWVIEALAR